MTPASELSRPAIFRKYTNPEQLAYELATAVAKEIIAAVNVRGQCHMVLPGGKSPRRFFEHLGNCDLPWQSIHFYPSDERCVPVGDRERNDCMIEEALLSLVDIPSDHLHRIPAELGALEGARIYAHTLQNIPVFDVALLGVGGDGHIASLFPAHPALYDCRDAVPVTAAPKPPPSRVSISMRRLRAAGSRHVIALGDEKRALFCLADRSDNLPVLQLEGNIWCEWTE